VGSAVVDDRGVEGCEEAAVPTVALPDVLPVKAVEPELVESDVGALPSIRPEFANCVTCC
jgi:hypothetical protein